MTRDPIPLPPRYNGPGLMHKWYALMAAPLFFLIAGTLANAGDETVSTVFALLAMGMVPLFLLLLGRDALRAKRAHDQWRRRKAAEAQSSREG